MSTWKLEREAWVSCQLTPVWWVDRGDGRGRLHVWGWRRGPSRSENAPRSCGGRLTLLLPSVHCSPPAGWEHTWPSAYTLQQVTLYYQPGIGIWSNLLSNSSSCHDWNDCRILQQQYLKHIHYIRHIYLILPNISSSIWKEYIIQPVLTPSSTSEKCADRHSAYTSDGFKNWIQIMRVRKWSRKLINICLNLYYEIIIWKGHMQEKSASCLFIDTSISFRPKNGQSYRNILFFLIKILS